MSLKLNYVTAYSVHKFLGRFSDAFIITFNVIAIVIRELEIRKSSIDSRNPN